MKFVGISALLAIIVAAGAATFSQLSPLAPPEPAPYQLAPQRLDRDKTAFTKRNFTNPVLAGGADPWVIQHDGYFYYCGSRGGGIFVGKSRELPDIGEDYRQVWKPAENMPYSKQLWAPELHFIRGRWFIYFAADDGKNENHRMFVLRSKTKDAQGEYELMGPLDTGDRWAIDGDTFQWHGRLYFTWSGWEGTENVRQCLYIAPMSDPWTVSGPRVLISKPELPWETKGGHPFINEGPTALIHQGRLFIIYSASGSWSNYYCLGRLNLMGKNPLDPTNWQKEPSAAFAGTDQVIAPGHASFVRAEGRDWIVYHAAQYPGAGWKRNIRIQPFTWNRDGSPDFGQPISPGVPIEY